MIKENKFYSIALLLGLSGCATTTSYNPFMDLACSEKENVQHSQIIFVEEEKPVKVESYGGGAYDQGIFCAVLSGALVGSLNASNLNRANAIVASCPNFNIHEPVRHNFTEMLSGINWLGDKNYIYVDNYEKAEEELKNIVMGTAYVIIKPWYFFSKKFHSLTGSCTLEIYKYNENFNANPDNANKKDKPWRLIYKNIERDFAFLKKYNWCFGIDKNAQQWYGKFSKHVEDFAKNFAQGHFKNIKD